MEVLEIIQPGPMTTVQDSGRLGYQEYGVPVSGAMDEYSLRIANLLVGNDERDACLEITLMGFKARVLENAVIAATGGDLDPRLNQNPLPMWQAVEVKKGDVVWFRSPKKGCRAYLAITGGFNVPVVMGSRSTYVKSGIGGFNGRQLRQGDRLQGIKVNRSTGKNIFPHENIPEYHAGMMLRVIQGPQDDFFTRDGVHAFLNSEYTVTAESDRMGYRLTGAPVQHKKGADIISDCIPMGAVQVPGNGLPIILMADRPTTGGYTKIATVISADLPLVAQAKPGDKIRFSTIAVEEAQRLWKERQEAVATIARSLKAGSEKGDEE